MPSLLPVERVIEACVHRFLSSRPQLLAAAKFRNAMEGWWKIELATILDEALSEDFEMELEGEEREDVVIHHQDAKLRIELKAFPTSYGGENKAITDHIAWVAGDVGKLVELTGPRDVGLVIWVVYPVPKKTPRKWAEYLSRIDAAGGRRVRAETLPLNDQWSAIIHVEAVNYDPTAVPVHLKPAP